MRKGRQTDLKRELASLSRRIDSKQGGLLQLKVKQAWSDIAGPTVLSHTTGAHLRGNELVVFVDSGLWATELSALSGRYLEALAEKLGPNLVRSVRFSVSRKVAEEFRIGQQEEAALAERTRDVVQPVPLSESERSQVEASVAAIPGESLRQAVLRATIADLEWKKGLGVAKEPQGRPEDL